jgi:bifunctional NMN adenylyltransferase/nudix hydrolase
MVKDNYQYDLALFIGRMRPPTIPHIQNIKYGLSIANNVVIFIGSAFQARSPKNPLYADEVKALIIGALTKEEGARVIFEYISDSYNNLSWVIKLQKAVNKISKAIYPKNANPKIVLIGHKKDASSDYLNKFQWDTSFIENIDNISATSVRDAFFTNDEKALVTAKECLPKNVWEFLNEFKKTKDFEWLKEEHKTNENFKRPYKDLKHQPNHLTVDAVIIQNGCVLLTERSLRPGLGLFALPGAFIQSTETYEEALLRSVYDKTKIKLPLSILQARITKSFDFDYPYRSDRGRFISKTFLIELMDNKKFPEVSKNPSKGTSDAFWTPISELNSELMFEDHMFIIETMIGFSKQR